MAAQKKRISVFSIIIPIIIILFVVISAVFYQRSKRIVYNNGNVSGNTAGNLYNGGLFCEYDGKVYFSNAYDNGYIYVMDSDGTNFKCLSKNTAGFINVDGHYIYYAKNNLNEQTKGAVFRGSLYGVHRLGIDGKHSTTLSEEFCTVVSLGNNTLYYLHYDDTSNLTLRSICIDGTDDKLVSESPINPSCIVNGKIYYNDVNTNLFAYAMNVGSKSASTIYDHKCFNVIYDNNYLYFMDVEDNYKLARVRLTSGEKETLTDERVDLYNLYDGKIFYQTNSSSSPALCRMNVDGSDKEQIVSGNFSNINMTSDYVYFNQFGYDIPVYRVSRTGSTTVTTFTQAEEAAQKAIKGK